MGFLNSFFLVALTATALPILIHILNRRRMRKVPFSSLEFIFELSRRRMSKVNFRRWIVLALRTLAVLFLVLAFARPTLKNNAALFLPGKASKHVVVCLDASASMHAEHATGTAFTEAQDLARKVVDESGNNDLFNVVSFASRADILFENGTHNKQIVSNVIGDLRPTLEPGSVSKTVATVIDYMQQSEMPTGEIYVISDFREGSDSTVVTDVPRGIRVILLPVYEEPVSNVSIDRVFTPRKLIRPGEVVRIGVSVTNQSREAPADFPLELIVGGSRKAEKVVTLSPAATANVTFSVSLNDWGRYPCRVSKNRDRLPIDDDRYFLLDVSQKVPVTLIRGRRYADDGTKQAAGYFFVDKALNPRGSGEGEFSVDVIDESDVTSASLTSQSVVVWTEPQSLDERRFSLFKRHVESGGSAMVFLGPGRRAMWTRDDYAGYLGITSASVRERQEGERFASFQTEHPIFSIFNEEELQLLARSRIRRYVAVSGVSPDSVLAYLGSGDPGVWECRRGRGRIIVVAATPDIPSGDLPLSPMFLPFIHTAVTYLASAEGGDFYGENLAGADLFFDLPERGTQGGPLHVVNDDGAEMQAILFETPRGETRAMVSRPAAVGFYRLLADTTVIAEAAVNVDTRESNLNPRVMDDAFLGAAQRVDTKSDFAANLQRERQGREIYGLFLLLAVSALVLESFLGRRA